MTFTEPPIDPRQHQPSAASSPTDPTPPPPPPPPAQPPKRVIRDGSGPVAGVATGIANYFQLDPVFVQVAFVVLTVLGGSGIPLYLAGWLLIPKASDPARGPGQSRPGLVAVGIGTLLLMGAAGGLTAALGLGLGFNGSASLFWLLLVGAGLYLLSQKRTDDGAHTAASQAATTQAAISHAAASQATTAQAAAAQTMSTPLVAGQPVTQQGSQAWGVPHTATEPPLIQNLIPAPDTPPITSVTLGLAAVGIGVLAVVSQVGDYDVGVRAYLGLVVAFCGAGLVVASIRGRAWSLALIGFLAACLLPVGPAFEHLSNGGFGSRDLYITSMVDLDKTYELAAGEQVLDLSDLELTEDGTLLVATSLGSTEILVPFDMQVEVTATIDAGSIAVFGHSKDGTNLEIRDSHGAHAPDTNHQGDEVSQIDDSLPILTIEVEAVFGEVLITHGR